MTSTLNPNSFWLPLINVHYLPYIYSLFSPSSCVPLYYFGNDFPKAEGESQLFSQIYLLVFYPYFLNICFNTDFYGNFHCVWTHMHAHIYMHIHNLPVSLPSLNLSLNLPLSLPLPLLLYFKYMPSFTVSLGCNALDPLKGNRVYHCKICFFRILIILSEFSRAALGRELSL